SAHVDVVDGLPVLVGKELRERVLRLVEVVVGVEHLDVEWGVGHRRLLVGDVVFTASRPGMRGTPACGAWMPGAGRGRRRSARRARTRRWRLRRRTIATA